MFGSDVVVSEAASLVHGIFEDLLGFGRKFDAVGVKVCGAAGDASHDFTDAVGGHAQFTQDTPGHAAFFIH